MTTLLQKRRVTFLHTAAPAVPPLIQFYSANAPDLEITNLLEDGIIRMLGAGQAGQAEQRLRAMMQAACDVYASELAMVTCSSVTLETTRRLEAEFGIPVIKIDGPMARKAVGLGSRIGVVVTFEGTIKPTSRLLEDTAASMNREIEITIEVVAGAYQALLAGDNATHDALLLESIRTLAERGVDSIVLAQVSMARVRNEAQKHVPVPVLSSFDTSLLAIREALAAIPSDLVR